MDKIQGTNSSQALPIWERQKSHRGHKSSVESALGAHRQRVSERQARIEERLNLAKDITGQFFPKPNIVEKPTVISEGEMYQNQIEEEVASAIPNMRQLDNIYEEAQVGPVTKHAIQVIEKDLSNPEDGPQEDTPKGSYVDYVV